MKLQLDTKKKTITLEEEVTLEELLLVLLELELDVTKWKIFPKVEEVNLRIDMKMPIEYLPSPPSIIVNKSKSFIYCGDIA